MPPSRRGTGKTTKSSRKRLPKTASGATKPRSARRLESLDRRRERALLVLAALHALYPDARCEMGHGSALELLVATILSAQCTDFRVNMTTPALFARYRTAGDFASAIPSEIEELIRPTGFFRNKTKSIVALGKALVEKFGGEIPRTIGELVTLPGVGRKTANVVLSEWFGEPGIAVDTHVIRLTGPVWHLTDETDPVKIESGLYELIPEPERSFFGIATIWHGRRLCSARKPNCPACALNTFCPSSSFRSFR